MMSNVEAAQQALAIKLIKLIAIEVLPLASKEIVRELNRLEQELAAERKAMAADRTPPPDA